MRVIKSQQTVTVSDFLSLPFFVNHEPDALTINTLFHFITMKNRQHLNLQ